MQWALETGHSTRTDSSRDIPRGLGFGLLSEFVSVNAGELGIFSNSCCAKKIEKINDYEVSIMKTPFSGTMVNITINCDGNHYFISNSPESEQFF
ncbi:MAG: hypothetical protein WAW41_19095 [Methylobacter sp.]